MNNPASLENQKVLIEAPVLCRPAKRARDYQLINLYKDVNPLDWEDWHWQLKHRIRTKEELTQIIKLTPEEEKGIDKAKGRLAMAITPYWASQIDAEDPNCPIRRQSVPVNDLFLRMRWPTPALKTGILLRSIWCIVIQTESCY